MLHGVENPKWSSLACPLLLKSEMLIALSSSRICTDVFGQQYSNIKWMDPSIVQHNIVLNLRAKLTQQE